MRPNIVKGGGATVFPVKHLRTFAGRLKAARNAMFERTGKDVSQSRLADLLGVTRGTVSGWESGAFEPPHRVIERLAEVLGVTPGWLAFGQEPRYAVEPLAIPMEEGQPFVPSTKRRRASGEE